MYRIFEQANHQNVQTDDQSKVKLNTYLKFAIDYQTIGLLESEFTPAIPNSKSSKIYKTKSLKINRNLQRRGLHQA